MKVFFALATTFPLFAISPATAAVSLNDVQLDVVVSGYTGTGVGPAPGVSYVTGVAGAAAIGAIPPQGGILPNAPARP